MQECVTTALTVTKKHVYRKFDVVTIIMTFVLSLIDNSHSLNRIIVVFLTEIF